MTRYREIAGDLRSRIARGEWAVGDTLPPIAQLQDQYGSCALNTVRAAQQLLVDEGVLETVAGKGAFVRRTPGIDHAHADVLRSVKAGRDAMADAVRALETMAPPTPHRPLAVQLVDDQDDDYRFEQVWGHQDTIRCITCDQDVRTVTRGWVNTPDYVDLYLEVGHDEHDIVHYAGLDPEEDQGLALLREYWWERAACLDRSAQLLLAGDLPAAAAHARRAVAILSEHPGIEDFGVNLVAGTHQSGSE